MTSWKDYDKLTKSLALIGHTVGCHIPPNFLPDVPEIAVDGGIFFARDPILWAGDGDSGTPPANVPTFFKQDQNITDLRFTLDGVRDWAWDTLHLIGFLGERKDHELANFGEIYAEMNRRPNFNMAAFYDMQLHAKVYMLQQGTFDLEVQGLFSVIAFEETTVTLSGACDYPCNDLKLQPLSGAGVSNKGAGMVAITAAKPVMVIFN